MKYLETISRRIINEVDGINIVYDISSKPPTTISGNKSDSFYSSYRFKFRGTYSTSSYIN